MKLKKILVILVAVFIFSIPCICIHISASEGDMIYSGTWSGVSWQMNVSSGELVISKSASGSGYMNSFSVSSTSAWMPYKSYVRKITVKEGVTSISTCAFYNCSNLKSISLPSTVNAIGNRAFGGCSALESITIPSQITSIGNNAFENCTSLISIDFPAGLNSIGTNAFYNCRNLTSIDMPKNVSVGYNAFDGCTSLVSATIRSVSGLNYLPKEYLKFLIIEEVSNIPDSYFYNFTALESVSLPEGLTSIGTSGFNGCSSLKNINIPESVITLGKWAFSSCSSLEKITLPEGILKIDYSEFGKRFKDEIQIALENYQKTEASKRLYMLDCRDYIESDFYFDLRWNFNNFSNSVWYIEKM